MGESFDILRVDAANNGTLLQIDFRGETTQGRMFVPMRDVFKALNNYLQCANERDMIATGWEKIDPASPPHGLIT